MWTLLHLKYTKHVIASKGENGNKNRMTGADGKDVIVEVPLGTVARDAETGEMRCEITEDGQEYILTKGGRGGLGNEAFKTSTNQAPDYTQPGGEGIEEWIIIEMKVLADVGIVGFPNAGKSTLLSVVSAAKPEIADYPFTTLVPNLGVVKYKDFKSFVIADIPGIIEGASEGKGLGLRFLRHIERNSILMFMIPATSEDIKAEYQVLINELTAYNPELLHKEKVLVISKCDLLLDEELDKLKQELVMPVPLLFISSVSNINIEALKDFLYNAIVKANKPVLG
jgi:GTP-binding protein